MPLVWGGYFLGKHSLYENTTEECAGYQVSHIVNDILSTPLFFIVRELQVNSVGDKKEGQKTLSSETAKVSTSLYSQILLTLHI